MGLDTPTSATNNFGYNTDKNTEPSNLCIDGNFGNDSCVESIYTLEKNVIDKINDFYKTYAEYVRCSDDADSSSFVDNNSDSTKTYGLTRKCTTSITLTNVESAYNAVIDAISKLNNAINIINSANSATITLSNKTIDEIKQKYSDNLNLRNELDLKMKEILKTDDSFVNQSKLHYDSTMYASIGWTILATSLLYYVFRKL